MNHEIHIDGTGIGNHFPPYIIAELSGNHNGDINRAMALLKVAKESGANAVKIQTYTADTMTIDCDKPDFLIEGGLWHDKQLYQLYEWAHTPWAWHQQLFDEAKKLGITIFSSPFDETAVDLLENLGAPAYKIASFELTDLMLIKKVAATGKPMIMSTGMANQAEIQQAISTARNGGCQDLIILHCISGYPTPIAGSNLNSIKRLQQDFDECVGLSDHTLGVTAAITGVALGAHVIEKHFTLDRDDGGPDAAFSLEPDELKQLCETTFDAWSALGEGDYTTKVDEKPNLKFRRSIYVVEDVKKGEVLTEKNVRRIRPGFGLAPKHYPEVLGKTASQDIQRGTALDWGMVG
jgi:pseudaminic acid synthase